MQVKSFDTGEFVERQGRLSADELDEIAAALAIVVEYD
jgi:mRNA-degrading endonuclease toxin of MazEF toxin-antitoxin module